MGAGDNILDMEKTRLSLYYLASYLTVGGLGFSLFPETLLKLFLSNEIYPDAIVRLSGLLLLALGVFIIQLIRLKIKELYPATLVARLVICTGLAFIYLESRNPLFLVLFGIVGIGVIFTFISYQLDLRKK